MFSFWVKNGVAPKGKHSHKPGRELEGIRSRMLTGRGSGDVPKLLEPNLVILLLNHGESALLKCWLPIAAGFTLHEDKLDVVFDDSVRFVWLAEKLRTVLDLVVGV